MRQQGFVFFMLNRALLWCLNACGSAWRLQLPCASDAHE
jgi:hypothetical protein